MRHRLPALWSTVALAIPILVIVVPFVHPVSIPFGDTVVCIRGQIGGPNPNGSGASGIRGTLSADRQPFHTRRLSLSIAGLDWSVAIYRASPIGDYDLPAIDFIK